MEKCLTRRVEDVPLSIIDPPEDVDRVSIDSLYLQELATSIQEIGLLQAILVRPVGDRYEVVLGHRRFLAHHQLGMPRIRAEIRVMSDVEAALARATENLARENLTPIEEAQVFQRLIEKHGLSLEQVAQKMGYKSGTIRRRLDLLRMPPPLQEAVHQKRISQTVAEELWPISDLSVLDYYLSFAIENGCTKEVARQWVKDWKDTQRRQQTAGVQGVGVSSPCEPRPTYIACDLCGGPEDISQMKILRICGACHESVKNAMKGVK
jgi:ParB family chromosome partitioning protein